MHRALLDILACPGCRSGYEAVAHAGSERGERIERGFLRCTACAVVVPIVDGFVFFTEPLLHEGRATAEALEAMSRTLFGTPGEFAAYRRDKHTRNLIEPYAAFHPFNESTRALLPLLPHVRPVLREHDFVLDGWARTGWSGEWLAGLLPTQRIVSLWEGNSSVLGYRGYRHLLGSDRRAANLDVIFAHPERPLPFRDRAFGFTCTMDVLHRYALLPFAAETLRVTREDGALIHAHVHLSNSEPEPFFERGCRHAHGRDYRAWLDRMTANRERRGYVFSEAALFDGPSIAVLEDDHDTAHYNGLLAILPPTAGACDGSPLPSWRYLLNPLFRIRLGRGVAAVAPQQFDGAVGPLLERHPVYAKRVESPVALDEPALLAVLLAAGGADRAKLLAAMPGQPSAMAATLGSLAASELLLGGPVSAAAHALQSFHGNQFAPDAADTAIGTLWQRLREHRGVMLSLADGTELDGGDLAGFAAGVPQALADAGLRRGDPLSAQVDDHPLLWIAAIAAAAAGFDVALATDAGSSPENGVLHLQGDDAQPRDSTNPMALGLDGRAGSLLQRLTGTSTGSMPAADAASCGFIELRTETGQIRCAIEDLARGCLAIQGQLERQLMLLERRSPLRDLVTVLAALSAGERLHQPPGD